MKEKLKKKTEKPGMKLIEDNSILFSLHCDENESFFISVPIGLASC